jgi:DNA-binding NtrC family response regulator
MDHDFIGRSPAISTAVGFARRAAHSDVPVLIQGESGTGKELMARAVHQNSRRREHAFIAVNCATLSRDLLVSELFGHERGAFTGADQKQTGKFERADGGTLFLDEIGDMDISVQPKLLRALEQREFERLGGRETISVNVRLIAATNKDLESACRDGEFREDLYYRLNVLRVTLPPLRERREDIPALIRDFISTFGTEIQPAVTGISPEAEAILYKYDWPGNVRQLRNVIHGAILMGSGEIIEVADLPPEILHSRTAAPCRASSLQAAADQAMRQCVIKAFATAGGNRQKVAGIVGCHPKSLPKLLDKLGLEHLKTRHKSARQPT